MSSFFSLNRLELESALDTLQIKRHHARSIFHTVYKKNDLSCHSLEQKPKGLDGFLENYPREFLEIEKEEFSTQDLSVKFVLKLFDGNRIESVLIPEKERITICVSSQVGCALGCTFCQTGRMGLTRNLTSDEIVLQYMTLRDWFIKKGESIHKPNSQNALISNIVFMGMGEPLHNVSEVLKAIEIFIDPMGLNLAPRKITVSTAGFLPGLTQFIDAKPKASLAFSLHSANNLRRSQIMPVNKKYPLAQVILELRRFTEGNKKEVFIQYTLIEGVNDSLDDAKLLVETLQDLSCKVNLIPLNPISHSSFVSPRYERVRSFQTFILQSGLRATVRFSKGQDTGAACGQLILAS